MYKWNNLSIAMFDYRKIPASESTQILEGTENNSRCMDDMNDVGIVLSHPRYPCCMLHSRIASIFSLENPPDVILDHLLPSGKRLHSELEIHHFQWENSLFLWPCSSSLF